MEQFRRKNFREFKLMFAFAQKKNFQEWSKSKENIYSLNHVSGLYRNEKKV